jgi:hypothetical protein
MIIGVTHDPDRRVIQRLSVSTKVSIGLPPNGDRNHPTKLDHFVFLRKKKAASAVEWEPDSSMVASKSAEGTKVRVHEETFTPRLRDYFRRLSSGLLLSSPTPGAAPG